MEYTVTVTDWGYPKEHIIESAVMTMVGVRAMLKEWGELSYSDVQIAARELEKEGKLHRRASWFPDKPYSFDIEAIRENVVEVPDCQYAVRVFNELSTPMTEWVTLDYTALKVVLNLVCGASDEDRDKFLESLDVSSTGNLYQKSDLVGFKLIAIKKGGNDHD